MNITQPQTVVRARRRYHYTVYVSMTTLHVTAPYVYADDRYRYRSFVQAVPFPFAVQRT